MPAVCSVCSMDRFARPLGGLTGKLSINAFLGSCDASGMNTAVCFCHRGFSGALITHLQVTEAGPAFRNFGFVHNLHLPFLSSCFSQSCQSMVDYGSNSLTTCTTVVTKHIAGYQQPTRSINMTNLLVNKLLSLLIWTSKQYGH